MRRCFLVFLMMIMSTLLIFGISWGQCPEDTVDSGNCDTLHVVPYKVDQATSFPAHVRVLLLVTHDFVVPALDSLTGFVIPLNYEHSNPSAFCSTSAHWNTTDALWVSPNFSRSIFRHVVEGTDTAYYNHQAVLARTFMNKEWDTRILDVGSETTHWWLSLVATGTADEWWAGGNRQLIASVNFFVQDTMTICIDTTFWAPTSRLAFTRADSKTFFPRGDITNTGTPLCFFVGQTDVREIPGSEDSRPTEFALSQNYPNPFNPETYIEFELARASHVKIDVFNIVGQKVRTLVDEDMPPGRYVADWDSKDEQGNSVSSGIYFYRMEADDFSDMKKMLLVK